MAKLEILQKKWDELDAEDPKCEFRINIDILNEAFGVGRGMYAKAVYPDKKNTYIQSNRGKCIIWMPKLYGNSSNWRNVLSEDGCELYEVADNGRQEDWMTADDDAEERILRIIFVRPDAKSPYRFVGVFENGKMDFCNHTYRRIATKIRLIGNPVTSIKLLDDDKKIKKARIVVKA